MGRREGKRAGKGEREKERWGRGGKRRKEEEERRGQQEVRGGLRQA